MTGFIRGLLGGKDKNSRAADRPVQSEAPAIERAKDAFYLDADDAKTYGNIDYMRSSKTVRRTFAKKRGETEEKESIKKVSALESVNLGEKANLEPKTNQPTFSQPGFEPSVAPSFDRRKVDTNLDMFRNMAKDIKKK
ncbi:MAG: hypothetical protein LVS60_16315 [Nodosilinea sp. LVE1205-7]|jgi:hypothetical protein